MKGDITYFLGKVDPASVISEVKLKKRKATYNLNY